MKLNTKSQTWTACQTLADVAANWTRQTRRLIVVHSVSMPGHPEPGPALVEVGDAGLITSIRRIRGDWA
ncbi:MAG: hypothetical protein ACI8QZ_002524 [Chlamydiales bacterium]|jgi:hypothetical protein